MLAHQLLLHAHARASLCITASSLAHACAASRLCEAAHTVPPSISHKLHPPPALNSLQPSNASAQTSSRQHSEHACVCHSTAACAQHADQLPVSANTHHSRACSRHAGNRSGSYLQPSVSSVCLGLPASALSRASSASSFGVRRFSSSSSSSSRQEEGWSFGSLPSSQANLAASSPAGDPSCSHAAAPHSHLDSYSSQYPSLEPLARADHITELAAASAAEPRAVFSLFREAANAMQWVHDTSGLPWWTSIPLTTLALRLTLLPVSMWQAKTVRTNYMVYKEAAAMTDKQLGLENLDKPVGTGKRDSSRFYSSSAGSSSSSSDSNQEGQQRGGFSSGSNSSSSVSNNQIHGSGSLGGLKLTDPQARQQEEEKKEIASAAERVKRGKLVLSNFVLLRQKLEAPHPGWIVVNPLIQVPVFVVTGMTLRMMGGVGWPGMSSEGALWFPDLTQAAMVTSFTEQGALAAEFPMNAPGFILPLSIFAATIASVRIGFGAAGARAAPADDWVGQLLRVLPYLLYGMTFVNLWVKLQLPHCALLHWAASSAFTLGLQVSLQRPSFRAAFNLPTPKDLQDLLRRISGKQLRELEEVASSLAPTNRGYVPLALPEKLVNQVTQESSPDILVVMGAQHSAQRRYREALFCIDKALQLQPGHVRAHYSRGQVFSLSGRWLDAQACFERAAELAVPGSVEKGQATYCVATAMHTQGNVEGAVEAYRQAGFLWPNQPVIAYSMANALLAASRLEEARSVVADALGMDALQNPRAPFRQQFQQLRDRIDRLLAGGQLGQGQTSKH